MFAGLCSAADDPSVNLIPWPKTVRTTAGTCELTPASRIVIADPKLEPLANVLSDELHHLSGIRFKTSTGQPGSGDIALVSDPKLKDEQYTLAVTDRAEIRAGSYRGAAWGTITLIQALAPQSRELARLPRIQVADEPAVAYRALLIDCARQWHPPQVIKDVIVMCRLYKINFLQLHLTDDQLFTFPSKAFPSLPTVEKGQRRHYTREELLDLVRFADERGVTIVPELETPGHSAKLRRVEPFGRPGLGCIVMADENTYEAFDQLIGEMCEVFKSSPYFHMGGDEASLSGADTTPEDKAYMAKHGLKSIHDLYLHHIVRIDRIIKKHGKQSILWGGFNSDGNESVKLPADIIAMVWEVRGAGPRAPIRRPIINAAWKPLYVVGNKAWLPEYLLEKWNIRLWQFHMNNDAGVQLPPSQPVLGAQMCAWEQAAENEIPSIRWRLPAMAERIYHPESGQPCADYARRFVHTDGLLDMLYCPVRADFEGLTGDATERAFTDTLAIRLSALTRGTIRYTLDGSEPDDTSPSYASPITVRAADVKPENYLYSRAHGRHLRNSARLHLKFACFDAEGKPVGQVREEILYAIKPLVRAMIYYSPKMFDNTRDDWKTARDWENTGAKPDREAIWPNLVFSVPSGNRGAVFVPLCSGVVAKGRFQIPQDGKYVFLYAENGGEVYLNGSLATRSNEGLLLPVDLKAGVHDVEVRYAHPHAFQHGSQLLVYAVLKEGRDLASLLDPPKTNELWSRPKKGLWRDHEELLMPLEPPVRE